MATVTSPRASASEIWPELPLSAWAPTCATLHRWFQVVGKIRLALVPPINHTWNVTLYPTIRGLTTMPMPYGQGLLEIDFDFVGHRLNIESSETGRRSFVLQPMTVAAFYQRVMQALDELASPVHIWPISCELPELCHLDQDEEHHDYDPVYANRFWHVLLQTTRVFLDFRARFRGKVSPIHFFWGAMDLACTRFSGRPAPVHPSMPGLPDRVTRDAYSHEVSSAGFWPGAPGIDAFFYSYAYPEPPGFRDFPIRPAGAFFNPQFGEFIFPYEAMRNNPDPDHALLSFLQTTYDAAATCAHWDREALEVH